MGESPVGPREARTGFTTDPAPGDREIARLERVSFAMDPAPGEPENDSISASQFQGGFPLREVGENHLTE